MGAIEKRFRQKAESIYQEYATRYERRFKWLRSTLFDVKKLKRDLLAVLGSMPFKSTDLQTN